MRQSRPKLEPNNYLKQGRVRQQVRNETITDRHTDKIIIDQMLIGKRNVHQKFEILVSLFRSGENHISFTDEQANIWKYIIQQCRSLLNQQLNWIPFNNDIRVSAGLLLLLYRQPELKFLARFWVHYATLYQPSFSFLKENKDNNNQIN